MKKIEEMLMKPKVNSEKMSEQEIQAKMDVLLEMMQMIQEEMGSRVKNGMMDHENEMKKVSVMAPDNESLEEGLEVAQEVLPESPEEKDPMGEVPSMSEMEVEEEDENPFGKKSKKPFSHFED